jgi:tRNA (adenine58-N1)-methyltransferase non-catalytic subunit
MKTKVSDSKEMIETLVANNKTFNEKTEFSQEKYLRKKDKKYHEFLQIRKPTIRLITDIFYRQTPEKTLGLRVDSLSQLISYSGVNSSGTYLVYDAGTGGLIPAVFLNSIGSSGDGRLIHLIPGNSSQMQGVDALNLTPEHAKKCLTVNIYSTLRNFYQGTDTEFLKNRKRKAENGSENGPAKRQNLDENVEEKNGNEVKDDEGFKIPKWYVETEEAVELLKKKVDSLVVVSKEDPFNIVKELLQFVNPGRPVVIFHTCKETLMETYMSLKSLDQTLNFRLISNWMRNYQVLPMRTHPEVQINGTSGYLLHGYTKK